MYVPILIIFFILFVPLVFIVRYNPYEGRLRYEIIERNFSFGIKRYHAEIYKYTTSSERVIVATTDEFVYETLAIWEAERIIKELEMK